MNNKLSDVEWTILVGAFRYYLGGATIASGMFPRDIMRHYFHRLNDWQRALFAREIRQHLETFGKIGHPGIDQPEWLKFAAACEAADEGETK